MRVWLLLLLLLACAAAPAPGPEDFRADARSLEALVNENYAYLHRFSGGAMPMGDRLRAEANAVRDRTSLVRYAERALLMLADHHAMVGSNVADSWPVAPTSIDLWIEKRGADYAIEAVRPGSPAEGAGIAAGDRLVAVGGVPIQAAVPAFWADLGRGYDDADAGFAARLLAGGKRDRPRRLTIRRGSGPAVAHDLPNLYQAPRTNPDDGPPLTAREADGRLVVTVHNSLHRNDTIAAFDAAMARARPARRVLLDLTDTPSGGNTTVARAILGWFVDRPRFYQVHRLPSEQRRWGIVRQWFEQVHPRPGKRHGGAVEVRVGRWTGSMGEGLAIGFDAIGARVTGTRMAGLRGAVFDHRLERSGLLVKLPGERLFHVDGTPREAFRPTPPASVAP